MCESQWRGERGAETRPGDPHVQGACLWARLMSLLPKTRGPAQPHLGYVLPPSSVARQSAWDSSVGPTSLGDAASRDKLVKCPIDGDA